MPESDKESLLDWLRQRLLSLPPFETAWGEALHTQLRRYLPRHCDQGVSLAEKVVNCFMLAPESQGRGLYRSLREVVSRPDVSLGCNGRWATELTCLVLLRSLNPQVIEKHLTARGAGLRSEAGAATFATHTAQLASLAYTAIYTGLQFDLNLDAWSQRWVDVPECPDTTDLVGAVLRTLLSRQSVSSGLQRRRLNPEAMSEQEILSRLVIEFSDQRMDGIASGLCVRRPPGITDSQWLFALSSLAATLEADVVGYHFEPDDSLVHQDLRIRTRELATTLTMIFEAYGADGGSLRASSIAASPPTKHKPPEHQYSHDFFVSHASEDKRLYVDELVAELVRLNRKVWYDKEELTVGDRLIDVIGRGLQNSRFAVLVVSPVSLDKPGWVPAEWEAILARENSMGEGRVMPVFVDVDYAQVQAKQPFLANYFAPSGLTPDAAAQALHKSANRRARNA